MHEIVLRMASLRDIDRIMAMEAAGFAAEHRERREVYERRIESFTQGTLLAHLGGQCFGCFFSEMWRRSPRPPVGDFTLGHDIRERHDARDGDELYISSMTVSPAYRGQGLGAQLFRRGIEQVASAFPQLTSALLLVNENWRGARSIYLAAGFRPVVRLPGFFCAEGGCGDAPADGIVMRRSIGDLRQVRDLRIE